MVLCAESPPYTPVNIATMTTGASFELHGVRKKGDPLQRETIFDIMARCAVKALVVAEKESVPAHFFPGLVVSPPRLMPLSDQDVSLAAAEAARLERPDFLWIYFTGFDRASHLHGPGGEEAGRSLAQIDRSLAELLPLLKKAGYGVLVTADHGHHENPGGGHGMKGVHDGTREEDLLVPLFWIH
jgi:predicted AlkP superfamily pyrophosphatase or phosphodiesterase